MLDWFSKVLESKTLAWCTTSPASQCDIGEAATALAAKSNHEVPVRLVRVPPSIISKPVAAEVALHLPAVKEKKSG